MPSSGPYYHIKICLPQYKISQFWQFYRNTSSGHLLFYVIFEGLKKSFESPIKELAVHYMWCGIHFYVFGKIPIPQYRKCPFTAIPNAAHDILTAGAHLVHQLPICLFAISKGVSNLIGPPFAGWLYDISRQWLLTFGLAGIFIGEFCLTHLCPGCRK